MTLVGNADVLKDVSSAAISKSMAEKYFGKWQDAIGRKLNIDNSEYDFQVAAVFEDMPVNSDFRFDIVASYVGFESRIWGNRNLEEWNNYNSNHQVYLQLPPNTNASAINNQLAFFEKKYNTGNKNTTRTDFLQPLADVHFDNRFENNGDHTASKSSLLTLAFIGMLIIFMACINFINLSTALAVTRSKEVGIRKVLGGSKSQLRWQILAETTMVISIASLLSILLSWIALPYIKHIVVIQSKISLLNTGSVLFIISIMVATILLSGLYPAFIMSSFKPIEAIKNKINSSKVGSISLRRILVVLQFAFSQMLIIATIIAISQMNFIKNADLGFNKDAVLTILTNSDSVNLSRRQAFKDALLALKDVKFVSNSFDAPSSDNSWATSFAFDKMEDRNFNVGLKFGDENYLDTYGIKLVAGRFYDDSDCYDTAKTFCCIFFYYLCCFFIFIHIQLLIIDY